MTNVKQHERLLDETSTMAPNSAPNTDSSWQFVRALAAAADDRKAADIVILKVGDVSFLADYFLVATGFSRAQVRAVADAMAERAKTDFEQPPLRIDGMEDRSWIVLDFGDVITHVLLPEEREYYGIEAFWGHAERFDFDPDLGDIPLNSTPEDLPKS